ncbi:hypothetical protein VNI00_013584 [Paramarasmius palmivorus]|uniref:Uncharacterized protein n=1 Tax=Paramarasmius palmivorus TaxID=297713 RepID=A0AAW0BY49_9AGAR
MKVWPPARLNLHFSHYECFIQFFASLTAFALVAAAGVHAAAVQERDLNARACTPSNCICNAIQGQFCGNEAVNPACTNGHVFECNGNSGNACDYGIRDSCVNCGQLTC